VDGCRNVVVAHSCDRQPMLEESTFSLLWGGIWAVIIFIYFDFYIFIFYYYYFKLSSK
jgi:hypothetical protein